MLNLLEDEGCPVCGEQPGGVEVRGPDEIVMGSCEHAIDARLLLNANTDTGRAYLESNPTEDG